MSDNIKRKIYKELQSNESANLVDFGSEKRKNPILFVSDLAFSPPTDVWETSDKICVMMEIADLKEDNFKVSYREGFLVIEGSRDEPMLMTDAEIVKFHKKEIDYGEFRIKIKMNTRIVLEQIKAHLKNGILFISLPKNIDGIKTNQKEIPVSFD